MKVAFISDCHLGSLANTPLANDSFENFNEAIERAIKENCDIIFLCGDLFDSRAPKTDVLAKAIEILTKPILKDSSVKLIYSTKTIKDIHKRTLGHLPVLAIHGNHERRSKEEMNILEALDNAGLLIHLNKDTFVFEKEGVRVAIHAMSNAPERFARDDLTNWAPKPIENSYNILVLHQTFKGFLYSPLDSPSLSLEDLPQGFDLFVNGHIHTFFSTNIGNTPFFIVGSTVVTQMEPKESMTDKGFLVVEFSDTIRPKFVQLLNDRKFIYDEIKISQNLLIRDQIEKKISEMIYRRKSNKPPLLKLKIFGDNASISEIDLRSIEKKYSDKAIIFFSKDLESEEVSEKTELLRNMIENKQSIEEISIDILRKNLEEMKYDFNLDLDTIFHLLLEGETQRLFNILIGDQLTLKQLQFQNMDSKKEEWLL